MRGQHRAYDPFLGRRQRARHRAPAGSVRRRHRQLAGRGQLVQLGRHAVASPGPPRLGSSRGGAVRCLALGRRGRCGQLRAAAGHVAAQRADFGAGPAAGRYRRLWLAVQGRAADAHWRGGLRLCRWLSAPRRWLGRQAGTGAGRWRAHPAGGPGLHGHDLRRPDALPEGQGGQRRDPVGPGLADRRRRHGQRHRGL